MTSAAAVLTCAIELLGTMERVPPIELIGRPPAGVSPNAAAYVRTGYPTIYVITSAAPFAAASCERHRALVMLASIIAHEVWHVRHGADEEGAYRAQLMTLLRLGERPDSLAYRNVYRAMREVLERRARRPHEVARPPALASVAGPVEGRPGR